MYGSDRPQAAPARSCGNVMLERKQIEGIIIQILLIGTQHVCIRNIDSLMLLGK